MDRMDAATMTTSPVVGHQSPLTGHSSLALPLSHYPIRIPIPMLLYSVLHSSNVIRSYWGSLSYGAHPSFHVLAQVHEMFLNGIMDCAWIVISISVLNGASPWGNIVVDDTDVS